jgi:hypothetical protein
MFVPAPQGARISANARLAAVADWRQSPAAVFSAHRFAIAGRFEL